MPSIRNVNPAYLDQVPEEIPVYLVDDSNGNIEANRPNMKIFRYADYTDVLGADEDLIPRKTDTCRSFGFYMAWKDGFRKVITLDDDCDTHPGFMNGHSIIGEEITARTVDQKPWYNTLDNLKMSVDGQPSDRFYARGVPYWIREHQPEASFGESTGRVVCNMGMWTQVPDINGLDKLGKDIPHSDDVVEPCLAVGPETNFSLCIMNVAILGEAIPAFYQLQMNVELCGMQLDRFGDIWSGYILKKLADIKGDLVTIGGPLVTHTKQGNTIRETRVEHYGHLLETFFYPCIDAAAANTESASYEAMYHQLSSNFLYEVSRMHMPATYEALLTGMGQKMVRWSELFMDSAPKTSQANVSAAP